MTTHEWAQAPVRHTGLERLASALRRVSRSLARWARALRRGRAARRQSEPVLEFYAEAGAPEGALYVDGQLVARLSGVTRL